MNRFRQSLCITLLLSVVVLFNHISNASQEIGTLNDGKPFSHTLWAAVLKQAITTKGQINRLALRQSPQALTAYLQQLESQSPVTTPEAFATPQDQIAYWLNAYNAIALKQVVDAYPKPTMVQLEQFYKAKRFALGQTPMSLDTIMNELESLLEEAPLAVFALSDGTLDSPVVLRQPYQGHLLDKQLRWQAQRYYQAQVSPLMMINEGTTCSGLRLPNRLQGWAGFIATQQDKLLPLLSPWSRGFYKENCPNQYYFGLPNKRFNSV